MQTIGKLSISLCRRWTVPTSRPTSLRLRHALRARVPLVPYRTSFTTQSDSTQSDSTQSDSIQSDSTQSDPKQSDPKKSDPKPTTRTDSGLVVTGKLEQFVASHADFSVARKSGMAYFDKTKYIPILDKLGNFLLVCRPRRFGKSLTVSMLRYFHGVEYDKEEYNKLFEDLDVNAAVKAGKVQPGRYLILYFDFSCPFRYDDMNEAADSIRDEIREGITSFKERYIDLLGPDFASKTPDLDPKRPEANLRRLFGAVSSTLRSVHKMPEVERAKHPLRNVDGIYVLVDEYDAYANEYMDPDDSQHWAASKPSKILKGFWSNIKAAGALPDGVRKVYLTGVTPLLLSDIISGANNHDNVSFNSAIPAICGLTRSNVEDALKLVYRSNKEEMDEHLEEKVDEHLEEKVDEHLEKKVDEHLEKVAEDLNELAHYANGFHFCQNRKVEPVFNTQTALQYLQAVKQRETPQVKNPPNSEVSEPFLRICTKSPAAVNVMQSALQKDENDQYKQIPHQGVLPTFTLSDLAIQTDGEGDVSTWRSLMAYMGGLTLDSDKPSEFMKIPNLVAGERFGEALINRVGSARFRDALYTLAKTGSPMDVLSAYCQLIRRTDNGKTAFGKSEEMHRNVLHVTAMENRLMQPKAEFKVQKAENRGPGFVDMLITDEKNLYTLMEFKGIKIFYLGLDGEDGIKKAEERRGMTPNEILNHKAKQLESMTLEEILDLKFENDQYLRNGMTVRDWIDGEKSEADKPAWKVDKRGEIRDQLRDYVIGPTMQGAIKNGKNFRGFAVVIVGSRHIIVREMGSDGKWVTEFQLAE